MLLINQLWKRREKWSHRRRRFISFRLHSIAFFVLGPIRFADSSSAWPPSFVKHDTTALFSESEVWRWPRLRETPVQIYTYFNTQALWFSTVHADLFTFFHKFLAHSFVFPSFSIDDVIVSPGSRHSFPHPSSTRSQHDQGFYPCLGEIYPRRHLSSASWYLQGIPCGPQIFILNHLSVSNWRIRSPSDAFASPEIHQRCATPSRWSFFYRYSLHTR